MMIKRSILILDDHSLFQIGIKTLISENLPNCLISCFNSISEIEKQITDFNQFDLIISDMELPGENIYDFFRKVRIKSKIPILVVSMHKKIVAIRHCQKIGVNGYILKNDDDFLIKAVKEILMGNDFFSPDVRKLINSSEAQNLIISEREKEVIKLICGGYSNLEISKMLYVSVETIKSHKRNIKAKLGLETNHDIVQFGRDNILL